MSEVSEKLIKSIKKLYDICCSGGALHIAIDDGNLSKYNIMFCINCSNKWFNENHINEQQHELEIYIATQLLLLPYNKRKKLYNDNWEKSL